MDISLLSTAPLKVSIQQAHGRLRVEEPLNMPMMASKASVLNEVIVQVGFEQVERSCCQTTNRVKQQDIESHQFWDFRSL